MKVGLYQMGKDLTLYQRQQGNAVFLISKPKMRFWEDKQSKKGILLKPKKKKQTK
ncbi:MAG: hypothetical protein MJA31_05645 [Clostridia bacterium]|nr:hypothetical protein [Clostridia bacterium]